MSSSAFIVFGITFIDLIVNCKAMCEVGWFGSKCQYRCRCLKGCDTDGECKSQICERGWFGYKCQYQDFVSDIHVSSGETVVNTTVWTDQDDSTCITDRSIVQVAIKLKQKIPFFFIALVVGDPALSTSFDETLEENFFDSSTVSICALDMFSVVKNTTVFLRCEKFHMVDRVILQGDGVTSLCSIYVSRDRNMALKQPTEQTSTSGTHYASNAVDGNTNATLPGKSCSMTDNETYVSQKWTLTFDEPVVVGSFEVIKAEDQEYSRTMDTLILDTLDVNNDKLFHVILPSLSSISIDRLGAPLKLVQIYYFDSIFSKAALSLCEVEVYGVCLPGMWGMDCKQKCECRCPDFCNEWDGSCPTSCTGVNAAFCTRECPLTKKEITTVDCSDRCYNKSCNSVDGLCTDGCNGYSDPPQCTKDCDSGYYGTNCSQRCPSTCLHELCDQRNGTCLLPCNSRQQGPFCDEVTVLEVTPLRDRSSTERVPVSSPSLGIGLGIGAGAVAVAVVVVVVIVILRRKHYRRKLSNVAEMTNQSVCTT